MFKTKDTSEEKEWQKKSQDQILIYKSENENV